MAKSQSKPQPKQSKTKTTKMTKTAFLQAVADRLGDSASKKDVKTVLDAVVSVAYHELKKSSLFVLPGFAKFVVSKKPARPARKGINPFTKEPTVFAAKPATKTVKARPIKAIKDAIA